MAVWSEGHGSIRRTRLLVGLCAGNFLEFYNFMAYAFFAPMIARTFFSQHTPIMGLFYSLLTFAAGFVARPLGAWAMGLFTRRYGYNRSLTVTFTLMAVGSAVIALTPGGAQIGMLGSFLILIARVLQGFSEGAEVGPTTALMFLVAPRGLGGVFGSLQYFTQLVGAFCSVCVGLVLSTLLSHDSLYNWGWRVPFLLGLVVFPVGLLLRGEIAALGAMPETEPLVGRKESTVGEPRVTLGLVLLIFIGVGSGTVSHWLRTYNVSYAITVLHLSPASGMAAMLLGLLVGLAALLGGMVIARKGLALRSWVIGIGIVNTLLTIPAYYICISHPKFWSVTALNLVLFTCSGFTSAPLWQEMLLCLPHHSRGFVFGIVYALAVSTLGGLTQPAVTWLIALTQTPMVAGYVMTCAIPVGTIAYALLSSIRLRR